MNLALSTNGYLPARNVSEDRIEHIKNSTNRDDAVYMGPWDKLKDFFCGGVKKQALNALYDLTHKNDGIETPGTAINRMKAFDTLRSLAEPKYQDRFQIKIESNDNGIPTFHYDIMSENKGECIVSNKFELFSMESVIKEVKATQLNDDTALFGEGQSNNEESLKKLINGLSWKDGALAGVSEQNKDRALGDAMEQKDKDKIVSNPKSLKDFVEFKMKSDSYANKIYEYANTNFSDYIGPENSDDDSDYANTVRDIVSSYAQLHGVAQKHYAQSLAA